MLRFEANSSQAERAHVEDEVSPLYWIGQRGSKDRAVLANKWIVHPLELSPESTQITIDFNKVSATNGMR
jgi:hypothetical protein